MICIIIVIFTYFPNTFCFDKKYLVPKDRNHQKSQKMSFYTINMEEKKMISGRLNDILEANN